MMKKSIVLLLIGLLTLTVFINQIKCQQNDEFDEFSEFDDSLDEPKSSLKNKPQSPNVVKQQQAKQPADSEEIVEDDDDDEFEQPEVTRKTPLAGQKESPKKTSSSSSSSNNLDDLDTEEFEHFVDDEEFEGFSDSKSSKSSSKAAKNTESKSKSEKAASSESNDKMPNLKIADIPTHLMSTSQWHNYVYEIVMIVIILIYLINYIYGKSKNYRLVDTWFQSHRDYLEKNFALVGDNGGSVEIQQTTSQDAQQTLSTSADLSNKLLKDSDNSYGLWCSGRQSCDGALIQLKLIKRQDLINGVLMQFVKPQSDQIVISVEFSSQSDIDSFVFCLNNKKLTQQLVNDFQDLATYCAEKKNINNDFLLPNVASRFVLLNELGEIPSVMLDKNVCAFLNKYPEMIEYLIVSDQFVGIKNVTGEDQQNQNGNATASTAPAPEDFTSLGIPKSKSIMILCLNVPGRGLSTQGEDMEKMLPAFQLATYLIDKVARLRLSKESKDKAVKKRKAVTEHYLKYTNKQRQEAAQLRKEEKRRADKERIMNESDPEKQRRLEEKELKKEQKKKLSKFKQVKIKSM